MPQSPLHVGVSACLLGEKVRYDGGHKLAPHLAADLGRCFEFVPVCPEVESGMPVPREPMRLEGDPAAPRLIAPTTRRDLTERMLAFCRMKVAELEGMGICGFIFKKNSPSCGLWRIEVCNQGTCSNEGVGLFASAVIGRFPLLPVVEEPELEDPKGREQFVARVLAYKHGRAGH